MMIWNEYQHAIFQEVLQGTSNLVVVALAGTGKTTTAIEAVTRLMDADPYQRVLMTAFNKAIADELKARVPEGVDAKTFHALGYAALRRVWGKETRRTEEREKQILSEAIPPQVNYEQRMEISKIASLAKCFLVDSPDAIISIMEEFGLVPMAPEADMAALVARYVDSVRHILEISREPSVAVTFDDMVYAPAYLGLRTGSYDTVFIDETQDCNVAQLKLALQAVKPGGRIVAIGDPNQAIYRFRGAADDSVERLIEQLSAKTLPLPRSYRCAKKIAREAKRFVPAFEVPDDAPDGEVMTMNPSAMSANWTPGDFVLSRTNAPLVGLCLRAVSRGLPACLLGSDLGKQIDKLVKRADVKTLPDFLKWLARWQEHEVKNLLAAGKEEKVADVQDRFAAVVQMAEGLSTIADLIDRAYLLSSSCGKNAITFSTVHKAKGLEAPRVWMLVDTFRPKKSREEANLWYVAVTRARESLYFVRTPQEGTLPQGMQHDDNDEQVDNPH